MKKAALWTITLAVFFSCGGEAAPKRGGASGGNAQPTASHDAGTEGQPEAGAGNQDSGPADAEGEEPGADSASGGDGGSDSGVSDAGEGDAAEDDASEGEAGADAGEEDLGPCGVRTACGVLRGATGGGLCAFRGVPYATPPLAELRWRLPEEQVNDCWDGVREATAAGSICPQFDKDMNMLGDEDCLTLNVWTPEGAIGGKKSLPIMFFIHGGGNIQGAGSLALYDGGYMAAQAEVVVVTINYRLGVFGYLAHEALSAESQHGVSGNYGIFDQLAALNWVRRNAAALGGDPAQLVIFGESAGGVNVCALLASPLAAGLFAGAIIESGGCYQYPLAEEEKFGATVAETVGCADDADVPACLRTLPLEDLLNASPTPISLLKGAPYSPNVDGYLLQESPIRALENGTHNHVPMIIGANAGETGNFIPNIQTEQGYRLAVTQMFGPVLAPSILAEYPATAYPSYRQAFVAVSTDARFVCPSRRYARAADQGQDEPVFRYFFTRAPTGPMNFAGAFHGFELFFVFHTFSSFPGYAPPVEETDLSDKMIGYWTRLAKAGDPNAAGEVAWPLYESATDPHLIFDVPISIGRGVRTEKCDFWDELIPGP